MKIKNISHKLCVCFREKNVAYWLQKNSEISLAEARLDLMNPSIFEVKDIISLPISWIATCHKGYQEDNLRLNLLKTAIESGVQFVDIDCNEEDSFINIIQKIAQINRCKTIFSYHNYQETPDFQQLSEIINNCKSKECNDVKVACKINSNKDIDTIHQLYQQHNNLIAIGMGEIGTEMRLKILEWGAPFTYVAIDSNQQTAEGQITFLEACQYFSNL